MFARNRVAAVGAEFLGTAILAFVVLAVSRTPQLGGLAYFLALPVGLTFILIGLALGRDMQMNPAYSFALWVARRQSFLKMLVLVVAQIVGALLAHHLYRIFAPGNEVSQLPAERERTVLVAEALGAFVFSFIAAGALYRQVSQPLRAATAGAGYTAGMLVASVSATIVLINPATAIASNGLVWESYILGPILGAVLGVNLYALLFADREPRAARVAATAAPSVTEPAVVTQSDTTAKAIKPVKSVSKSIARKPRAGAKRPSKK